VDVRVTVAVGWGVAVGLLNIPPPPPPLHPLLTKGMMIIKTNEMTSVRCRLMSMEKIITEFKNCKKKQAARAQPVE
jgi:hypothetical protein